MNWIQARHWLDDNNIRFFGIFSEIDEPLDLNENMSTNIVLNVISKNDVFIFFCGNCYSRSYLAVKLFIPLVILKKIIFQYFLNDQ